MKIELTQRFDIKDMRKLHHFVRMNNVQVETTGNVWIGQPAYTESLLKKFQMDEAKPVATLVDTTTKLVKTTDNDVF